MTNCPHCKRMLGAATGFLSTATEKQEDRIVQLLKEGKKTSPELQAAGCLQYTARIWWLRHRAGYQIRSTRYNGVGNDGQWHKGLVIYELIEPKTEAPSTSHHAMAAETGDRACS